MAVGGNDRAFLAAKLYGVRRVPEWVLGDRLHGFVQSAEQRGRILDKCFRWQQLHHLGRTFKVELLGHRSLAVLPGGQNSRTSLRRRKRDRKRFTCRQFPE